MKAVSIYFANSNVEEMKSEIEAKIYRIIQENFELERILRQAEDAGKKLKKNKEMLIELAIEYASLKGEL